MTSPLALGLILASMVVGPLHHLDHVLRVDHSGWPFIPAVTPLTFSFAAYPVLLFVLFASQRWNWTKFALIAALAGFTVAAHVFIETPQQQYFCWANNASIDPRVAGQPNLLDVRSPLLGALSVANAMLLNVLLTTAAIAFFFEARRPRSAT